MQSLGKQWYHRLSILIVQTSGDQNFPSLALNDWHEDVHTLNTPAGRDWVDNIIQRFLALGNLKANEQVQDGADTTAAKPTQYKVTTSMSLPDFVTEIEQTPLPPNHADS